MLMGFVGVCGSAWTSYHARHSAFRIIAGKFGPPEGPPPRPEDEDREARDQ